AGPATMLPDFSSMVQKYGPAVVNISVVSKVSTSWSSGDNPGDDSGDNSGDNNDNPSDSNPFGPNSPFAPFFRGLPFQMPQPQPPPPRAPPPATATPRSPRSLCPRPPAAGRSRGGGGDGGAVRAGDSPAARPAASWPMRGSATARGK